METDFSKEFFQRSWGKDGYYEEFSYGVGFDAVCAVALTPFFDQTKTALEIGCGGGAFTHRMMGKFKKVIAMDVIEKPPFAFEYWDKGLVYFELPDQSTDCGPVEDSSIDFCFSYNVFCHLSNPLLTKYLKSVHRVLKPGGDFVFMIANFAHSKIHVPEPEKYVMGQMLPMGHFYQDKRTLPAIADRFDWTIVNRNMIPEHRDIIIHLKKK